MSACVTTVSVDSLDMAVTAITEGTAAMTVVDMANGHDNNDVSTNSMVCF